jgi:hypothetical protein
MKNSLNGDEASGKSSKDDSHPEEEPLKAIVPGGCLVLSKSVYDQPFGKDLREQDWMIPAAVDQDSGSSAWIILQRRVCSIQWKTCRWLPSRYDTTAEYDRLANATICLCVHERQRRRLTEPSIRKAVQSIQTHGYCILAGGLVSPTDSGAYGQAALQDLHAADRILQERDGISLYNPGTTKEVSGAFRELSLREDFRVDLRHGPALQRIRGAAGSVPRTITAQEESHDFLRGHVDLLEVVRRVMNPVDEALSPGNVGRYNFNGSGPDGSFQDVRLSPVGSIISFPGAVDQALHADTPHLFEHQALLPAHYINIFTPGISSRNDHEEEGGVVGQTALLHGTHRLDATARYWDNKTELWKRHLVRPRLQIGDVLLFDCRILHFGLGNESTTGIERPLLYTNVTMHWFHDPKNWDNERPIFASMEETQEDSVDHNKLIQ